MNSRLRRDPRLLAGLAGLLFFASATLRAEDAARFNAAPFGRPLPDGPGVMWDDPREIHQVVLHFRGAAPAASALRLEYWGSHWPEQHLPKDREPGGGDNGWTELGNWHTGGWRVADTDVKVDGQTATFDFRPVNQREFPKAADYPARFRYTLKIRVPSGPPLPPVESIEAFTDSSLQGRAATVAWKKSVKRQTVVEVFNGSLVSSRETPKGRTAIELSATANNDPNTFDRTLVTVKSGPGTFTFKLDDLAQGPLYLPEFGAAVLPAGDPRDYAAVERETRAKGGRTLYDRVGELPEQTWKTAWEGMPPKKSRICFSLGLDGGREHFRLDASGELYVRWHDQFMKSRPGRDTERLSAEKPPVYFRFGLSSAPAERHIEEECLPICVTTWETNGLRVEQTAFATELNGAKDGLKPPAPDTFAVALARFVFTNNTDQPRPAVFPVSLRGGEDFDKLRVDAAGLIWHGNQVRGQLDAPVAPDISSNTLLYRWTLGPRESRTILFKMPFLALTEEAERTALAKLDFDREHKIVANYWRRRLDEGSQIATPEPVLTEFYRAEPGHLLINSEFDTQGPQGDRRFARVGSFNYGAYGNESCMMVLDLDRRGYHREAAECLEGWLHYQGTVGLPGAFKTKEGVLYGAGGYESGGYNQHHGWILWTLAEHYRFTRDDAWLKHAAPGILAGADWIIRETAATTNRADLAPGLLPPGDLEDIGDWWNWLSTSCYTWRGLDGAAWALEQLRHPETPRIRAAADAYHAALLSSFLAASARSPVVRLRDGTAVPQIPSYVQRRGRSYGWICQTLEGAMHLLITQAIDPNSALATGIIKDYEDNLYLSNQYGYTLDNFDKYWFGRGGMSMQACLLLDVEPYLYRDDAKQALRAMFNAIAVSHFPDVHMNTEHALPEMGDWRGDHYKTSDEANACGWLRDIIVREQGDNLLVGQAIPREWLNSGEKCGIHRAATYFGPMSVLYAADANGITADLDGPTRNPPKQIRLRFRAPDGPKLGEVTVNGAKWTNIDTDWVNLPGDIGRATIIARRRGPDR